VILTVTLNAALDATYFIEGDLNPGETHRVCAIAERAGGKGVNVARVLHQLGEDVIATGLVGGRTGDHVQSLLDAEGVSAAFVRIAGESRRTTVVVAASSATGFWEPGPAVTGAEWADFRAGFERLLARADTVVLSGSLPPGIPVEAYADLIRLARAAEVPTLLDADGDALRFGIAAGPAVVVPNAAELAELSSQPVDGIASAERAGRSALTMGGQAVVATLGVRGVVLIEPGRCLRAWPLHPVAGNPTGAGDACVAGLARTVGRPWAERLSEAVALGAAAAAVPTAGAVDLPTYQQQRLHVALEEC